MESSSPSPPPNAQHGGRGRGRGGARDFTTLNRRAGGKPARARSAKGGASGGRWGDGNDEAGTIATLKDNFGFIEPLREGGTAPPGEDNIFFHFSTWCGRDAPRVGDEVSYSIQPDRRTGRDAATRVTPLPPGTLPTPPPPVSIAARAVVQRELRGGRGGDGYGGRLAILPNGVDTVMAIGDTASGGATRQVEVIPFDARDCERGTQFNVGDLVECMLTSAPPAGASQQRSASRIRLLERGGGLPREQGVVISLKDNFGFIRPEASVGEVFFHFSEAPRRHDSVAMGEPSLVVGDEVSFVRTTDQRSQKVAATNLRSLPAGTVRFETVGDETLRAVVTRPMSGGDPHFKPISRRDKAQHFGVLKLKEMPEGGDAANDVLCDSSVPNEVDSLGPMREPDVEGAVRATAELAIADQAAGDGALTSSAASSGDGSGRKGGRGGARTYGFALDDICEPWRAEGLFVGDVVTFKVATERATGDVGATEVRLEAADWRRGFVTSTREHDGMGLIRPVTGGTSLPFPLAALPTVAVGSEVEYRRSTEPRGKRPVAACVRLIPPGSIILDWVWPQRWEAVVKTAPPRVPPTSHKKGHQSASGGGGADSTGEVELVRPMDADEESAAGGVKQGGLDMGQAWVPDISEVTPIVGEVKAGEGEVAAVKPYPEGAAQRAIESLLSSTAGTLLQLPLSALQDSRTSLAAGDIVSLQIAISAIDGTIRPCAALLVAGAEGASEQGIVTTAKHDYGFLRAASRPGVFFFHYSELPGRTHQVRPGDEFEFVVAAAPPDGITAPVKKKDRGNAIRLRPLPPGTVQFEDILMEAATGVVEIVGEDFAGNVDAAAVMEGEGEEEDAEPSEGGEGGGEEVTEGGAGGGSRARGVSGSSKRSRAIVIRLDQLFEGEHLRLAPSRRAMDQSFRGALPAAGTSVTCRLGRRKTDGQLVVVDVQPVPLCGTVRVCHGASGILRATTPLPAAAVELALAARAADAAEEAASGSTGLQDLVGSGASWGRDDNTAAAAEASDADASGSGAPSTPVCSADGPSAPPAAVYISAGQSPFQNAAPTVKTTKSRLAELAETHSDKGAQQVPFGMCDTICDSKREARVGVGDEVEFALCFDPKTLQLVARRVRVTKDSNESDGTEYTKRQVDPAKMTRFAKGPDGTRGFAIGRGKPLAPVDERAAIEA